MPRTSITITTEVDLDIETAAKWFAGLTDDEWCKFFVAVSNETALWSPHAEGTMYWATGRHLATCECSTDDARAMLHDIVKAMEYQADATDS
jgi:hypothetical protein